MSSSCQDIVWDYVRPSSSFVNAGTYAPPSTPRVHAFAAVPRTEPADCKTQPPVGGLGTDVCRGRRNPYRGGLGSFHLRFTYLREGGHQVSRSPGPGSYETRHLTGGALVKRPKTASPCFRRPGGRLQFEAGGTWHEETPLVRAERRGTVRGSVKTQPQHYSLSFRSKADRLVVNKPPGTTHEGLGPGCYDVSKDGKSVGVKTEKRVARGKGSTNQFLVDWRAYMKQPPKVNDGHGDCGCGSGNDGRRPDDHRGKPKRSPPSVSHNKPSETPQATVPYTLRSQSERWPPPRKRILAVAGRRRKAGGPELRLREGGQATPRQHSPPQQQHRHPEAEKKEEEEEEEESFFPRHPPQRSRSSPVTGRAKRPASAVASLRIPSATEPHMPPGRCCGLPRRRTISGGGSGLGSVLGGGSVDCSGSGSLAALSASSAGVSVPPQFVPRPPSVDIVSRRRTACPVTEASQRVDDGVDSCCRRGGRQSGEGEGGIEVCAPPRTEVPGGASVKEAEGVAGVTSCPVAAVDHARRLPPSTKPSNPEKADVAAGSEKPFGVIEDDAPRRASRPAPPSQRRPSVNGSSTVRSEDLQEEDGSGKDNASRTDGVLPTPLGGSQGGEPTVRAKEEAPCAETGHTLNDKAGTTDEGREGVDQANTVSSSGLSPGASSGKTATSPPPSPRIGGASYGNPSPESSTDSCSSREDTDTDARRTSQSLSAARTSSGTAVVARTLALATTPPGQNMPNLLVPRLTLTAHEPSSRSSTGGEDDGEEAKSALWRIQSKGSFTMVLGMLARRSLEASRDGPGEPRVDPFPARLAAAIATDEIVLGALSAAVATRLSGDAGSESGGV